MPLTVLLMYSCIHVLGLWCLTSLSSFQQYFSYIVEVSFAG